VLSGGGSFGAWEIGALQALWDVWTTKTKETFPPIRVVAGTSTGAVIAPFALPDHGKPDDRKHLQQVDHWYQTVTNGKIFLPRLALAWPTARFLTRARSVLDYGYPTSETFFDRFYQNYPKALGKYDTLDSCAREWPHRRLAIATVDFASGCLDLATNEPSDVSFPPGHGIYDSRLFDGIVASAMSPMAGPAVRLRRQGQPAGEMTPHLDGGVATVAPFGPLFKLANGALPNPVSPIALTHVIVISSYPLFPSADDPANPFPPQKYPSFKNVGMRFDTLLSEAAVTRDIQIARAALALRKGGMSQKAVEQMTGLSIADPLPVLIEAVPTGRLNWDDGEFKPKETTKMRDRGYREAKAVFLSHLP
jgi:predicted acylesterase/phospholipase RssA